MQRMIPGASGLGQQTTMEGIMGRNSRIGLALSSVFVLVAAGCGSVGGIHQADAFGKNKTYAVVTVMANEKVGCTDLGGNPCGGGVFGLASAASKSNAYSEGAADVLERTYPTALKVLRTSPNLKIAPDVKGQRTYRATKEDEQPSGMMRQHHTVAKGYKYFSDEKLGKMARDLKVDGVITVTLSYSAARSGVQVAGAGGGHKAQTTVMVSAVDKDGKTVWVDYAMGQSDNSVSTGIGAVDFPKLRPLFVDATDKAVKKLMENFNSKTRKM
jgi:hypothetical protein